MMSDPMRDSTSRTGPMISTARGVGCIRLPLRTNNGSAKKARSLPNAALTEGWLRCSFIAAALMLLLSSMAVSTRRRFRSSSASRIRFSNTVNSCYRVAQCASWLTEMSRMGATTNAMHGVLRLSCPDRMGIVARVGAFLLDAFLQYRGKRPVRRSEQHLVLHARELPVSGRGVRARSGMRSASWRSRST